MIRKRVSFKIALIIGIVEIISMFLFFIIINHKLTDTLTQKAISDMNVIAKDRAQLVETYINDCCDFLSGYSRSIEIINVLEDSKDPAKVQAASDCTTRYAEGYSDIEGLYVAEWDTYVLAHINPDSVNQTFRDPNSAKALEDLIKSHTMPFCTGIVMAPVTKRMVIPVYAPVYDSEGNAIGFAGAAFFSDLLEEALKKLTDVNSSPTGYALINASNNVYIFNDDRSVVGKTCTDKELLNAVTALSTGSTNSDSYNYSSKDYVTSCYYMYNRNWVFVVRESKDAVFGMIMKIRISLITIFLAITFAMVIICVFSVEHQMTPLKVINAQIEKLKTGDYRHDKIMRQYRNRSDEFGSISNAISELHLVLENQYELFLDVFEAQTAGTLVTDSNDDNVILINETALNLYGIDPAKRDTVSIADIRAHFAEDELQTIFSKREEAVKTGEEVVFESTATHDDGSLVHILSHTKACTLSNGETVLIFCTIDITDRKKLEENPVILNETDELTSLLNRRSGEKRVDMLLDKGTRGVFCLFDVNKLKDINEDYGHTSGDIVLKTIADTMKANFRNTDILMRLGGDEFVVFASDIDSIEEAKKLINRFMDNISRLRISEINCRKVSVSLGAVITTENKPFSKLYFKADSLIYDCKKQGGNVYKFYED